MASDNERPELEAFKELEQLVRHLGDELAAFRRRALQAEGRLKDLEGGSEPRSPKVAGLERENRQLREKLEVARDRTKQMLARVRFLRQQAEAGGNGGGGSSK